MMKIKSKKKKNKLVKWRGWIKIRLELRKLAETTS